MTDRAPSRDVLRSLADALDRGALVWPASAFQLQRAGIHDGAAATDLLARLAREGLSAKQAATVCRLMEESHGGRTGAQVDVVWTGIDAAQQARDTAVVARELFRRAQQSVLMSTFSLWHDGAAGPHPILGPLAERMVEVPDLRAQLFVHVGRTKRQSAESAAAVLHAFAKRFRKTWPAGVRTPVVFYDPRTLDASAGQPVFLHAKCIVVDDAVALVTSANLTAAAMDRNVELGLLVEHTATARAIRGEFDALFAGGVVRHVPGLE